MSGLTIKTSLLVFLILLCAVAGQVSAHSPSGMDIGFDPVSGTLRVTLTHAVDDPAVHYVSEVEVARKGEIIQKAAYFSQPTGDTFSYQYLLPLSPGETVRVTARCNIGGSLSREYTLPSAEAPGGGQQSPSPASRVVSPWVLHAVLLLAGLILFLGVALLPTYGTGIRGWFRYHVVLAGVGGILTAAAIGLVIANGLLTGGTIFRQVHVTLGVLVIILLLCTLVAGGARKRIAAKKTKFRTIHIWLGRVLVTLAGANILLGLAAAGVL
ncbi:MAG: hypothetical protein NQU46_00450 [Methanolinea sp.]|nr:hypothetical protein [Methanolinea sp.]